MADHAATPSGETPAVDWRAALQAEFDRQKNEATSLTAARPGLLPVADEHTGTMPGFSAFDSSGQTFSPAKMAEILDRVRDDLDL